MNWQPALATSAFRGLHDELVAYFTLFCDVDDLLALSETNSVFYVFSREEPLWMAHCLRRHGGEFTYKDNWRLTTFFPRNRPVDMPLFPTLSIRGFASDFLYRRWYRAHMSLKVFDLPDEQQDPFAKRIKKFETKDITYQEYFEQYSRIPFILKNAIGNWKATTEWTMEKLTERFPSDIKHRITHNLDFFGSGKSLKMSFADYFQYIRHQNDETPLYIFDPNFGEKAPALLEDYNVEDLKFFKEDMLKVVAQEKQAKQKSTDCAFKSEASKQLEQKTEGKSTVSQSSEKVQDVKPAVAESLRPDFRWTVIGPERTGAPWHTDPARTSAWNALVKGRKRWAIYPPDSPPPGVSTGKNGQGREHALNMTSLSWYLHVYPTLLPHQKPIEIIQEEGEVIYVPSGWWHLILNLDMTIAVTQNFVDSHNLMAFVKDLLSDQEHEALGQFQHKIKTDRPETFLVVTGI
uniref:JmjC domain-containing protein n=1 Tax=Globisporangium ultimum (strain ATCC 200006 / CBS 805.95 / DAOM BR144) TaxID=431595 RepID=K3WNU6_GLOUD